MKEDLCVIVDTSGSMNDMGKIHLQRNLCHYVLQLKNSVQHKYADLNIHFFQWTQNTSEINLQSNGDIPALEANGSASLIGLLDFMSKHQNTIRKPSFLILTDGNFDRGDFNKHIKAVSEISGLYIRTVAVGADADLNQLKKLSSNNSVFLSENISAAVDSAILDRDELVAPPKSIAQILPHDVDQEDGAEEDWDA